MNEMLQRVAHFHTSFSVGIQLVYLMAKSPRKHTLRTQMGNTEAHSGPSQILIVHFSTKENQITISKPCITPEHEIANSGNFRGYQIYSRGLYTPRRSLCVKMACHYSGPPVGFGNIANRGNNYNLLY